jgi:hypothetical protein
MGPNPRHRFALITEAVEQDLPASDDPGEAALHELLRSGTCPNTEVGYAYELFRIENHRAAVDAFLLAKVDLQTIAATLEIPAPVLEAYRHLFLDTDVFRNRLELTSFASSYEGSAYAAELVRTAVVTGLDYLLWAFGKPSKDIDNRVVVRRTMVDAYFRGMAHRGNPVTSPTAREALRWWDTAVGNAQTLEKLDPQAARSTFDELRLVLDKKDETISADASPVPLQDIIH